MPILMNIDFYRNVPLGRGARAEKAYPSYIHSFTEMYVWYHVGARGSVVDWGTVIQAGRSRFRVSMKWIFTNWSNPFSRTVVLGSTQPLTEVGTRNIPGGKGRPVRKADGHTAIYEYEPII
jgi:hypothetical protein